MLEGLRSVIEHGAGIFLAPGYVERFNEVGVTQMPTEADDANPDQEITLMVCAKDPAMLFLIGLLRLRYLVLKARHGLSALPWWNEMEQYATDLVTGTEFWASLPQSFKDLFAVQ